MRIIIDGKDPFLNTICEDFNFSNPKFDPELISTQMFNLMIKSNGLGLAAPQIGISNNLFILGNKDKHFICFNPKIISQDGNLVKDKEGCLSFPLLFLNITRYENIHVSFTNEYGLAQNEIFNGIWSRCFQHELDHLNGIIFTNYVSRLSLDQAKRKRKKLKKRGK